MDLGKAARVLARNKYVLAVLVLGLVLLLLPRSTPKAATVTEAAAPARGVGDALEASGIPLDTESERLRALLREMRGVGEAEVLLSHEGAVVVCAGGDEAGVRFAVTQAVSAYTGLGSDRITVLKMR